MLSYEDDILESVRVFLSSVEVEIKDAAIALYDEEDPTPHTIKGTLSELFPNMRVLPIRRLNLENFEPPCIGVAFAREANPIAKLFDDADIYQHSVRLLCTGTVVIASGSRDEPDYDATVFNTMQLQNALVGLFLNRRDIDLLSVRYDSAGTKTVAGRLSIADNPPIMDVDMNRFILALSVGIIE